MRKYSVGIFFQSKNERQLYLNFEFTIFDDVYF